ncbi:hypothetical protein ABAC460_21165 [Asticcacaulis sp. AC460]|uniref:hypothetical protein n=1 Tax=Asticcacaulis sp. AC460 TaxID=1282360 RepID=UPI0003C3F542|nr:hypothetical protein [Asticcacaulis sp. AC460]ESQ87082.1 hypothetical protein ABAC460_21165 [Asticcacaulis sp. AC460]
MRAIRHYLVLALILATVTGCQMLPLGPDLASAPSPFGESPRIELTGVKTGNESDRIEILHTPQGDTTLIHTDVLDVVRTFDAQLTWQPVPTGTPGFERQFDYWLVGINVFRSRDRSAFAVFRFPQDWQSAPGSASDAGMIVITCEMMGFSPGAKAVEEAATAEPPSEAVSVPTIEPDIPDDNAPPSCGFASLEELQTYLPVLMAKAAEETRANRGLPEDEKGSTYAWSPIRVRIP